MEKFPSKPATGDELGKKENGVNLPFSNLNFGNFNYQG